jgi:hypothetical protein
MPDVFGSIISRGDVERAVLRLLRTPPEGSTYPLLVYYLAERERQAGLPARTLPVPPAPESFRGTLDFTAYVQDLCPMVLAVVQPVGAPERLEGATYGQWYDVQLGAVIVGTDEDSTRALADEYAASIMAAVLQQGSLGGFAIKTDLSAAPKTEFFDPKQRRLVRSIVGFRTQVAPIVGEWGGPSRLVPLGPDPYAEPGVLPTVESVDVTLDALTPADPLP